MISYCYFTELNDAEDFLTVFKDQTGKSVHKFGRQVSFLIDSVRLADFGLNHAEGQCQSHVHVTILYVF
jgi:hypothetical protein